MLAATITPAERKHGEKKRRKKKGEKKGEKDIW